MLCRICLIYSQFQALCYSVIVHVIGVIRSRHSPLILHSQYRHCGGLATQGAVLQYNYNMTWYVVVAVVFPTERP